MSAELISEGKPADPVLWNVSASLLPSASEKANEIIVTVEDGELFRLTHPSRTQAHRFVNNPHECDLNDPQVRREIESLLQEDYPPHHLIVNEDKSVTLTPIDPGAYERVRYDSKQEVSDPRIRQDIDAHLRNGTDPENLFVYEGHVLFDYEVATERRMKKLREKKHRDE